MCAKCFLGAARENNGSRNDRAVAAVEVKAILYGGRASGLGVPSRMKFPHRVISTIIPAMPLRAKSVANLLSKLLKLSSFGERSLRGSNPIETEGKHLSTPLPFTYGASALKLEGKSKRLFFNIGNICLTRHGRRR